MGTRGFEGPGTKGGGQSTAVVSVMMSTSRLQESPWIHAVPLASWADITGLPSPLPELRDAKHLTGLLLYRLIDS